MCHQAARVSSHTPQRRAAPAPGDHAGGPRPGSSSRSRLWTCPHRPAPNTGVSCTRAVAAGLGLGGRGAAPGWVSPLRGSTGDAGPSCPLAAPGRTQAPFCAAFSLCSSRAFGVSAQWGPCCCGCSAHWSRGRNHYVKATWPQRAGLQDGARGARRRAPCCGSRGAGLARVHIWKPGFPAGWSEPPRPIVPEKTAEGTIMCAAFNPCGCCNKSPQPEGLKTCVSITLRLWGLEA